MLVEDYSKVSILAQRTHRGGAGWGNGLVAEAATIRIKTMGEWKFKYSVCHVGPICFAVLVSTICRVSDFGTIIISH